MVSSGAKFTAEKTSGSQISTTVLYTKQGLQEAGDGVILARHSGRVVRVNVDDSEVPGRLLVLQHALSGSLNSPLGCQDASVCRWACNGRHRTRTGNMLT